ncbi:glycosyltransferase family 2 protein [Synechococcus sp. PCC 7336]|uniref:glycosyltransferase n=1 Tax=Synechococcus sp. PCC 7336 TaxID=195250 RepID=UPI0003448FBE|nr:glycosyltransferase family A protein [Synechococcus sp. PCC 7336]
MISAGVDTGELTQVTPHIAKIAIISPVRNEAEFIAGTLQSVVNQTVRPMEWLIVDDGSTDATAEIVRAFADEHDWIRLVSKPDRGGRSVGPGVVETFYFGYEHLQSKDYDFICKLDGDVEFGPHYFATLLELFAADRYLGAASGKPFQQAGDRLVEERSSDEMVAGMINFYRRDCFEAIGGFVREVHWDGIAFHRARMAGWRTCSLRHPELNFIHKRVMGSSHKHVLVGRLRWGRGQYFMGTHPLYIFAIGLYRLWEKPSVVGGLTIVAGYFGAMLKGMPRYSDRRFRQSLHAWQFERMRLGQRLENLPPFSDRERVTPNVQGD